MPNKVALYWGVDGSIPFRLSITATYAAAPWNGTLIGATVRLTLSAPGYTATPILDSSSPTFVRQTATELVGYFAVPAATISAAFAEGEGRHDLVGQIDLTPASGPKGPPFQFPAVVYPAA